MQSCGCHEDECHHAFLRLGVNNGDGVLLHGLGDGLGRKNAKVPRPLILTFQSGCSLFVRTFYLFTALMLSLTIQ